MKINKWDCEILNHIKEKYDRTKSPERRTTISIEQTKEKTQIRYRNLQYAERQGNTI